MTLTDLLDLESLCSEHSNCPHEKGHSKCSSSLSSSSSDSDSSHSSAFKSEQMDKVLLDVPQDTDKKPSAIEDSLKKDSLQKESHLTPQKSAGNLGRRKSARALQNTSKSQGEIQFQAPEDDAVVTKNDLLQSMNRQVMLATNENQAEVLERLKEALRSRLVKKKDTSDPQDASLKP